MTICAYQLDLPPLRLLLLPAEEWPIRQVSLDSPGRTGSDPRPQDLRQTWRMKNPFVISQLHIAEQQTRNKKMTRRTNAKEWGYISRVQHKQN